MSKISVKLDISDDINKYLMSIKKITQMSLNEIKSRFLDNLPIVEYVLFYNDHDEVVEKLRELIGVISSTGGHLKLHEFLDPDDSYTSHSDIADLEISIDELINIFESHDEGLSRFEQRATNEFIDN